MKERTDMDTRARILRAAEALFARDGFDATGVQALARAADVNKAMLYYYFDGKDAILDTLIDGFFSEITAMGMDLVEGVLVSLIRQGRLDILPDRFHFSTQEDMRTFQRHILAYYRDMVTFMLSRRAMLRILMMESLKNGRQKDALFGFFRLTEQNQSNPIYQTLHTADADLQYSEKIVLQKFFFSLIPLIAFAVYYDGYKALSGLTDEAMQEAYAQSLFSLYAGYFVGNDLVIPMEAGDTGFAQWQALAGDVFP